MTARMIRNSSITKYLRCKRSWMLSYQRNLETNWDKRTTPQKFDTGIAVHAALEAFSRNEDWSAAIDINWSNIQDELSEEADIKKWENELVVLPKIMVEGYIEWREENGIDVGYELLGAELKLEAYLGMVHGEDVTLYGTIDRLMRNPAGKLVIDDYKTVQTMDTVPTLATNWQVNNYALLVAANYGEFPVEGRHTQLKRVKRTATAKPPFYGQIHTTFNEVKSANHRIHLSSVVNDMVATMQVLESDLTSHHWACPPNPTRDCSWDCSFRDVCPTMDNGGDWEHALEVGFRQREEA